MARTLDVYLHRHLTGCLNQDDHGELFFDYADGWLSHPNAVPLSHSLPLRRERYTRRECRGFFAGLLPEAEKREVIAWNLGISARNDFAMLDEIGGDCAGAVTFLASGEKLPQQTERYRPLTGHELAEILRILPRRPLMAGEDDIRLSLAGAQDKIAVHITEDQFSVALGGAPSSHILKPAVDRFEGIVFNEFLCMRLAQAIGLPVANVKMGSVEGLDYLLIARYDRITVGHDSPERLHQEDFCQALGIVPENKYQNEGGPSLKQCFDLVREISAIPVNDLSSLLDAVIFNFLIGNHDAHGKNFSLLYGGSRQMSTSTTRLAPFYDMVCTVYYPDLSEKMAMKIGGEYASDKVSAKHFERLAEEAGLGKPMVKRRVQDVIGAILSKLPELTGEHPVEVGTAKLIHRRCERARLGFKE